MKLSILTPTVPSRANQLAKLSAKIENQIGAHEVEHLVFCDNRKRSIGEKRQALIEMAQGEYIAFVDDDDDISDDYVSKILSAIERKADLVTFRQGITYNGRKSEIHFGVNNPDEILNYDGVTLRAPWHVCVWNRVKVKGCQFLSVNYGEDLAWSVQARKRIKTAVHIDTVLHYYRHDAQTTLAPE